MRRGEIWWADPGPPMGRRPVVLLSRDEAYKVRNQVTVAPVTTHIRYIPTEVELGPEDGLPKVCVVNLDVLATIPKESLQQRVSRLSPRKVRLVEAAIRFALGMADPTSA
ncbi:MAG TPA: type II toxin-antitoxin system PemK/MazF family toxin [Thermoanaerobaculia bacterium]|nr:type II toxin-antitoxin system PemK/MazF family toxin [Thermoanaerobaculia bacterium]